MHVARIGDWLTIIGFVFLFVCLYGAAGFLVIRRFLNPPERTPKLGAMGCFILVAASLSILPIVYAFIEPFRLEVTHVTIPLTGIPKGTPPIRIVQFSDTHCDQMKRLEDRIPQAIRAQKPDLIVFTGDACNSFEGFDNFIELIDRLRPIAPLCGIMGDWDSIFGTAVTPLKSAHLPTLGRSKLLDLKGVSICLTGVPSGIDASSILRRAEPAMVHILLNHSPDADVIINNEPGDLDLVLCGHTHGGQIALPFYGALITQSVQGKKYESGLHKLQNTWIYTNRGIGMEGRFPRVRFCSVPEITVFDLVPAV